MFKSWRHSWTYSAVHSPTPINEEDFKDSSQQDSMETEPLAGIPYQQQETDKNLPACCRKLALNLGILTAIVTVVVILAVLISFNTRGHKYIKDPEVQYTIKTHVSSASKTNNKPHPCGNSSAQARDLGCSFDQLTWAWLPPNCPSYTNNEFINAEERPWVYYEDLEQTRVVDSDVWEQVLDGELRIFGERREHVTHCIYRFLSLSQIIRDGTPYHEKLVDYKHSEHCANMLLEIVRKEPSWNDVQTFAGTVSFDQYCEGSNVAAKPASFSA